MVIKEVQGISTKTKLPLMEKLCLSKGKDETPNQTTSPKKTILCTHYKKPVHSQFRCYTKFLERFESQMNRLIKYFNSLKNNILNNRKGNKTNQEPRSQPSSFKSPLRTKQIQLRNDRAKFQVVFNVFKVKSSSEWCFDSGYLRHMIGDKTFFTFLRIIMVRQLLLGMGASSCARQGKYIYPWLS